MNSWDDTKASCSAPQEGTAVRSLVSRKDWLPGSRLETKEGPRLPTVMGLVSFTLIFVFYFCLTLSL